MNYHAIAIDGPAGAGKSTVAKMLAKRLGYVYIDTGAMYRATTYKAMRLKINLENAEEYSFLETTDMKFIEDVLFVDGEDITKKIRTNIVNQNVSLVASHIPVRNELVRLQQKIASETNVVMDGRDIGTVVFPDAELKLFMTASSKTRAQRRFDELVEKGQHITFEDVLQNVEERDYIDTHREDSPLVKAEDAIEVDNSSLSKKEQFELVLNLVKEKM